MKDLREGPLLFFSTMTIDSTPWTSGVGISMLKPMTQITLCCQRLIPKFQERKVWHMRCACCMRRIVQQDLSVDVSRVIWWGFFVLWKVQYHKNIIIAILVGGFSPTPFEKYARQIGSSPRGPGMKIKNVWNQKPKNLIRLFWGWVFHYISHIHYHHPETLPSQRSLPTRKEYRNTGTTSLCKSTNRRLRKKRGSAKEMYQIHLDARK